FQHSHGSPITF
nr:immunoglobulin light chain junction region [Macaca mulatta]